MTHFTFLFELYFLYLSYNSYNLLVPRNIFNKFYRLNKCMLQFQNDKNTEMKETNVTH